MNTYAITSAVSTSFVAVTCCGRHQWHVESLRGTNRHRRVETVRCMLCGERRRRVWKTWNTRRPKERRLERES